MSEQQPGVPAVPGVTRWRHLGWDVEAIRWTGEKPDRLVKLTRHADHDPSLICRPALGYGLCELLEPGEADGSETAATREASDAT